MAEFKLGRIKFVYQGTWAPSTAYVVDDVVTNGGKTYICVISNTSSALFTTDLNNVTPYWSLVADGQSWKGSWTNNTYYNPGDMSLYGGIVYICTTGHTSVTSTLTLTATGLTTNGSGIATLTYATQTGGAPFVIGQSITIAGFTPTSTSGDVNTVAGTYTVITCTSTQLTFALTGTYTATTPFGTVAGTSGLESQINNWTAFASNLNWVGTWTTSTRYKFDDFVYYGGITYVCNTAHVSASTSGLGLENDIGKWTLFNAGLNYLGTWSGSSVRYKLNDIVKYGADLFICTTQHTSTGTTIDASKFGIFVNGFEFMNSWSSSNNYAIGDVVTYGGYTYTAIQNSTSGSPQIPSTATTYWQVFTTGLNYVGAWLTGTSYKVGNIVTLGAFSYVALLDNSGSQPTASNANWGQLTSGIRWNAAANTTYTNVASTNVSATGSGSPTFTVTRTGTSYSAVIGSTTGTGYTVNDTLKILGSALGGASPSNDLVVKVSTITGGGGTGPIGLVTVSTGYASTWKTGTTYVVGDAVYYGNSSYICISGHIANGGVNDPINDSTATYWNILASGADSGALTTQGDIVYYGVNGPTRLPVGTDGQILRVNGNTPAWQYYGQLQNIVYVAPNGVDATTPGRGLTLDAPWASVQYACKQIEDGYLNVNAGKLLTINKQFMMKEVNQFILNQYSFNVTGTSASGNTFIVGGSSSSSQTTTVNMYYGMPITFSATTGGVTVGTVYYVNTIPSSTTFTVSVNYQTGVTLGLTPSSAVASTATFNYTQSKAERDSGTIIDAVVFDLTHGGNLYVSTAAQSFFATLTSYITTAAGYEINVWIASLNYLNNTLFSKILTNSAPTYNYQTLNGISSGNRAIQNITGISTASVETNSLTTVQNLLNVIVNALTAGTYANLPQLNRPHTSIYVKTGTYNEYGPIVVPQDTAIVGDELRSTIVQVAGVQPYLTTDTPKTVTALQRIQSSLTNLVANTTVTPTSTGPFPNTVAQVTNLPAGDTGNASAVTLVNSNIAIIQNMFSGNNVITGPTNSAYPNGVVYQPAFSMPTVTGYNTGTFLVGYGYAVTQLQNNYQFITDEIRNFLNNDANLTGNAAWSAYSSTYQAETFRDLSSILDALQYDLTYGCNDQSMIVGRSYFSLNTALLVSPWLQGVKDAIARLSLILQPILLATPTANWNANYGISVSSGNTTSQSTSGTAGSAAAVSFAQARIADILYWINVGFQDTSSATFTGSITATTLSVSGVAGTIKIGQVVTGGTVAAGTYITAGSGASWTVSVSQSATATGSTITISPVASGAAALTTAANLASFNAIQAQKQLIQNDTQAWVQRFFQNETLSLTLTNRDAGYIVDALSYDVLFNSNFNSIISGRSYNRLIPSIASLQAKIADATYGSFGFIGAKVRLIAANGAVAQASAVIDDMISQIRGQSSNNATLTGTITGTQLAVTNISSGVLSAGMALTGTGINSGTSLVSGATISITGSYITSTSGVFTLASALTSSLVVGQQVTISGTFSAGSISSPSYVTGTTYYVIGSPTTTTFQLSATQGGSAITTTIGGSSGSPITGITITASPTTWLLNYSQSVSSTTTAITTVAPTTNYVTMGTTNGMVPGLAVTIAGTSINNLSAGTYYVKQVLSSTQLTLSQTYNGSVFAITATNTLSGVIITGTNGQFSCSTVSTTLVVGQPVVITGTFGGTGSIVGYSNTTTTYYIIATNGSTTFQLSTAAGGSGIVTTAGTPTGLTYTVGSLGSMTAVVYGIYGGLGITTSITASGTAIPVTAVTTSTNLITVNSNAGMYVNMPIVFNGLPANITTTATTISSSSITLGATVASLGVVVGQPVWFTGVMPPATGVTGTITFNQIYYVKTASASAITIASTLGGTALTLNNASGLTLTATFNAAGGLVNGTQYWVNAVTSGTYPAAGTTITVTSVYKSGTAATITNSLTGLSATCTVGVVTPQYLASKIVNGTSQMWGNPSSAYQSYAGYNNTLTTIQGAEIIRANKTFLATEAIAYVSSVYSATVTGTAATTNIITTNSAHNFIVGDVIQFVAGGGAVFGNLPPTPVWVLTTPTTTTFTVSSTQPGTGTQTALTMTTTSGSCTAVYYIITSKGVRDAGYHIDGLVYDLGLTGNYKSLRSAQLYLSSVYGSTPINLFQLRNGSGMRNMTLNGLSGSLGLPNSLGTRRPTAGSYVSFDPGFGPNDSSVWITQRSPYVQNITNFGNGCVGMKIDAALHNGGNKGMVSNDFTQVLSDGIGVWATGRGSITEAVSVFCYYGYAGYLAELGARIRATNGNSSYGTYGVIAEGIDSYETPIYANLNNRANQAYITNVVTDASNQVLRFEFANAGGAYTNGVPSISGAGYNAAAVQDEYRDASVFETRLIDLNNGQGVGGSNYLTATNVTQIGAVGTITIANSDIQLSSAYVGMRIQITAGTGVGQYANIISYRSDTKIANIIRSNFTALTITNSSTSVFTVASTNTMYASQPIYIGAAVAGLSTATVYYVVGASLSNNGTTFSVATTAANAAANTTITLTATSATAAVLTGATIVGTALSLVSNTNTIYVGMLLTGTGISANTYIVSGSGLSWVVSVSQNLASTTLTATISVPLYEAGWDTAVPGVSVQPVLDATSNYIIEPAIAYTGPGFKSVSSTLSGSGNTWSGLTYGAGYFVATATSASVTSYSTNGSTWLAGGALPTSTTWSHIAYGGGQGAIAIAIVGGSGGSGAVLTAVLGSGTTAGQIVSITVTNGGYNYITPPTIVITDATGSGATAICQVLSGTIQSVTMTVTGSLYANPTVTVVTSQLSSITASTWGQNYFSAPTVTIAAPFTATVWSSGGAVTSGNYYYYVDTTVSPNVRNYYLASGAGTTFSSTAPTFTNAIYGKSGYGAAGTFSTGYGTNVTLTYVGTLAVAVGNLTNNGVSSFTVTQPGYGYTTTPIITITDPYAGFLAISSASTANAWNLPSTLGSAWTNNSNVLPTSTMNSLAYGNNLFITVGGSGSAAAASLTNTTGPGGTWVNQSSAITANSSGYSKVSYGNGMFVAIGGTVSSYMTANPAIWTSGGALSNKTWTGLAYGNGRFVALASDGTLQYNFMTWGVTANGSASTPVWTTISNNPLNKSGITTWSNLRYGQGLFFAIATSSQSVATSWDGINWTVYASTAGMPSSSNWTNSAFGNPQNATLGAVPTWVSISNTSGTTAATIQTGATPLGRTKVVNNLVSEIRMIEPGSGFPRGNVSATTTSTNLITVDSTINLVANQPILFNGTSAGGIITGQYYYVVSGSITSTQFQIALSSGGLAIPLSTATISGMTYFASPIVTITDPNSVNKAPVAARIGNGALGNPSFSNRGTSNSTATTTYSGDGYADLYQTGTFINVSGLYQIPTSGCNVTFSSISNTWYKLVQVTNVLGLAGNYTATFQINPGLSALVAPVHNTQITTNLLYSNTRMTGHDFLYIGTGGITATNYPNVDPTKAVQSNQVLATGGGRVFFTSTDQDGNFNVGNLFGVQQSTGTATLNASAFNLSGLQSLTLGSVSLGVGSATITQFSTDPYFTANSDNVVPTQKAIKAFITAQIGGGQSTLNVNTITSGQIYIAGNTISNTTGAQIYVSSKMLFTGGIDGSPVALLFFTQK